MGGGGGLALVTTFSSCAHPPSLRLQKEIHSKSAQKFTQITHHAGKFRGQEMSETNASSFPLFVCDLFRVQLVDDFQ